VHTNGEEVGHDVTGTLGSGPSAPEIVHFQGTTDGEGGGDPLNVRLQQGNGQAELTGVVFGSPNETANLLSGDIFLSTLASGTGSPSDPNNLGMTWIELAFQGVTADFVSFTLTLAGEDPFLSGPLAIDHNPNGENKWGFLAENGESILNLHYSFSGGGGEADALRQVRITTGPGGVPVPEPATWTMMLLGFGVTGFALRRKLRKGNGLAQLA
jgi:hypothetical protein